MKIRNLSARLSTLTVSSFLLLILAVGMIPASATASGTVNFYTVTGTGASAKCTNTAWSPVFTDGNVGFSGNLGSAQQVPVVSNGQLICIQLILTGQSPSTSFTVTSSGSSATLTPVVTGNNTFSTDASGDANVYLIFSVTTTPSTSCVTNPIKISPDVSGAVSTSNQISHDAGGTDCGSVTTSSTTSTTTSTQGVPEFPTGALGVLALLGIAIPALLLLRRGVPLRVR